MVIASTNSTDGRCFPKDMGEPRSFVGFPLKFTWSPGVADALSIGILGWVDAQPKVNIVKIQAKMISVFLAVIYPPPYYILLSPEPYGL
jgi:hypothetical protein